MKPFLPVRFRPLRCLPIGRRGLSAAVALGLALASAFSGLLSAQTPRAEAASLADARTQAIKEAESFARQRSFAQAERASEAASRRATGTPEWELDTGHALMEVAFARAAEGDTAGAMEIVTRALKRLELAARMPSREGGSVAAQAKQLAALLQERFVGDREAAKRLYREAVQLDPQAKPAVEALDRLERADAVRAARAAELKGRKSS